MTDWFDSNIVLIQGTMVSLLLAMSIQYPLRLGVFSFAGVGCYGIGAYTAAIVTLRYEWPAFQTIAVATLLAGAVGYLLGLVVQRLGGLYLGMATISFDLILSVIVTNGGELTGGPTGLFGAIADLTTMQIFVICVIAVALLVWSERGRLGRRIETVRNDPELALSMGIKVGRLRRGAFLVSGLLGGCAGALQLLLRTAIAPENIGFAPVVLALTMIIVGGAGSWLGALIGAVIFTWLPTVLELAGAYQAIIYGAIVALAAIWVPGGLLGVGKNIYRRIEQQRRPKVIVQEAAAEPAVEAEEVAVLAQLSSDAAGGRTS
jgi:branched-chain amino acid transport system permease protein